MGNFGYATLPVAVHIGTATDPEHFHGALFIVNAVDHSVVPDVSTMEADEFVLQRMADPVRIPEQSSRDEVHNGPRSRLGKGLG
jgi:hypothetical protein